VFNIQPQTLHTAWESRSLLGTEVLRKLKTVEQATTSGKIFSQFLHSAGGRAGAISVRGGVEEPGSEGFTRDHICNGIKPDIRDIFNSGA
jgi:hypothetical protein